MVGSARRRESLWLAGLAVLLLAVMVWPYAVDGHRFGVGPDVPVYLWWTRVGASQGFSTIGSRPGGPALAAALAGTLNLSAAAVTAGLASALGVAVGMAAAALVRAAGGRRSPAWWLAGGLAGVFSVHLVAGYLANLVFAVPFLAAGAVLAAPRRAWWAAALLLAGGGLAHPSFLVHGIAILAGTAVLAWGAGARDEARDVARAATAGGLVAGAGVLAVLAGPGPLDVETSKDGYLRRAGLDASLVDAYRERFRLRAARYVQWIAVPLALPGTASADGLLQRFLVSWLVLIALGIPIGYVTGWFPPDRLVTFGFAVPIAAALGLVWLRRRLAARPRLAWIAVVALAGWMIVGPLLAWGRQRPFISLEEAAASRQVMTIDWEGPADRPIVFLVDDEDTVSTFKVSRAANIARGAAPPARARDVYVFLGRATDLLDGRPTRRSDAEHEAISRLTLGDIPAQREPVLIAIRPFYSRDDVRSDPRFTDIGGGILASDAPSTVSRVTEPQRLAWGPSTRLGMIVGAVGILVLLGLVGVAYSMTVFDDPVTALCAAPAFGTAVITLAAVALDATGLRLRSLGVALAASALAGLGGVALLLVKRQRDRQASS